MRLARCGAMTKTFAQTGRRCLLIPVIHFAVSATNLDGYSRVPDTSHTAKPKQIFRSHEDDDAVFLLPKCTGFPRYTQVVRTLRGARRVRTAFTTNLDMQKS